jgi:hypothetical protein
MKRAITAPNRLSQRNRQKSGAPPMTADGFPNRDVRHGAVFRIERRGPFNKGGAERVTRLYRRDDLPEDQCWLRAPGWCLAYR